MQGHLLPCHCTQHLYPFIGHLVPKILFEQYLLYTVLYAEQNIVFLSGL